MENLHKDVKKVYSLHGQPCHVLGGVWFPLTQLEATRIENNNKQKRLHAWRKEVMKRGHIIGLTAAWAEYRAKKATNADLFNMDALL